jgi:hypothetical protein
MAEWKDAWVENGRVLVRLKEGRVLEVGKISYLLMMAICEETLLKEQKNGQVRRGDQEGRSEGEGGSG